MSMAKSLDVTVLKNGHCNLHMELLRKSVIYGGRDTPTKEECGWRLKEAIALVERIEEISLGMWEFTRWKSGEACESSKEYIAVNEWVELHVALGSLFLKKVGIPAGNMDPLLYGCETNSYTPIRVTLGCPECAHAFAAYCQERWGKKEVDR